MNNWKCAECGTHMIAGFDIRGHEQFFKCPKCGSQKFEPIKVKL